MILNKILGIVSFIADMLPLLLLLWYSKLLKSTIYLSILIWSVISVVINVCIVTTVDSDIQKYAYYTIIIESIIVAIVCYNLYEKPIFKKSIVIIQTIMTALSIIVYWGNNFDSFPNWLASSCNLMVMVYCFFIFVDMFYENSNSFLKLKAELYIILGYFIYTSGCLFLYVFSDKLPNFFKNPGFWAIYLLANIIKDVMISKAILVKSKGLKEI